MDTKPTASPEDGHAEHEAHVVVVDGKPILAPDERDPNSSSTLYVGAVGVLILVLCFIGLQSMYRAYEHRETYTKIVSQESEELRQLEQTQAEQITGYRVIDPESKRVGIPIERAMSIVAEELPSR